MTIAVHNETGASGRRLADRIEAVLETALPQITDITGLPQPEGTIRLVTPRTWKREVWHYVARQFEANLNDAPATDQEQSEVKEQLRRRRTTSRWHWPLLNGMTVTDSAGHPQTLIVPQALAHTGLAATANAPERFVIHETVHHAQLHHSANRVLPPVIALRPSLRSQRVNGLVTLFEGHADWTELQATYTLYGPKALNPATRRASLHTSARWRLFHARESAGARWAHHRHGTPLPPSTPRDHRRARAARDQPATLTHNTGIGFVRQTVAALGTDRWNAVWTDPELLPTDEELTSPSKWIARIS